MKLNIKGPICNTGYGIAVQKIVSELYEDEDISLRVIPQGNVQVEEEEYWREVLTKSGFPHWDGHSLKIWHQNDLMDHIGNGKKVGWPIFELDRFTKEEQHHLGYCDELIVCSKWARSIVKESFYNAFKWTDAKIHVVPLGVDTSIFRHEVSQHETTRFFNAGKWEIRKGHDILREAFDRAFTKDDDVELYLICDNPFPQVDNNAWRRYYKQSKLADKIHFINRLRTHSEVANIMKQMDCGVFPARAEGFNLELLESMACGMQVITTNYSAHTEYCNSENANLIDIDELEYAYDGVWFHNQGKWAKISEIQIDQIAEHMRKVHEIKKSGSSIINTNGIETAKKFSWKNSAYLVKKIFQ